jgi:hypothetical protein
LYNAISGGALAASPKPKGERSTRRNITMPMKKKATKKKAAKKK